MDGFQNNLREASDEGLLGMVENVLEKWTPDAGETIIKVIERNLGQDNIDLEHKKCIYEAASLYYQCRERQLDVADKLFKLFEIIYYAGHIAESLNRVNGVLNGTVAENAINVFRFMPMDINDNLPVQNLVIYLMDLLNRRNIKKYRGACYRQVYHDDQFTHYWERVCSIEEFIYQNTQKDIHFAQWKNLTNRAGNAKYIEEYLTKCNDPQFPELIRSRGIYAFHNGVYICHDDHGRQNTFLTHAEANAQLDSNVIACRYFENDFDAENTQMPWYDIATPALQSILDYQYKGHHEYTDIARFMYILLGRLLYPLGLLDDWQVIPFIKGLAGTGKSTIITQVTKNFYEEADVGQLSNESERLFGLSAIHDKFLFIAQEVKRDFSLGQAQFQTMVSGETMSIPIKNKTAVSVQWTVPGIMAGNETPNFTDNSGSMTRRLVIFPFSRRVNKNDTDTHLSQKLKDEMCNIIVKCNRAYLEAVAKYGKKNIWSQLPSCFLETQEMLAEQTNSMQHFLASGKIIFGETLFCPESLFKDKFMEHCRENNFNKQKFLPDFYSGPFDDFSNRYKIEIKIARGRRMYDGTTKTGLFVQGVDVAPQE